MAIRLALACLALPFVLVAPALATPLLPGQTLNFSDVSPLTPFTSIFIGNANDRINNLTLLSDAEKRSDGTLTFEYVLESNSTALPANSTLTFSGFGGHTVDFAYLADNGQPYDFPTTISRSLNGDVITISFGTTNATQTPRFFFTTETTSFITATGAAGPAAFTFPGTSNNGNPVTNTDLFTIVRPTAVEGSIPEPAALTSLGLLVGLFTWRRRKAVG